MTLAERRPSPLSVRRPPQDCECPGSRNQTSSGPLEALGPRTRTGRWALKPLRCDRKARGQNFQAGEEGTKCRVDLPTRRREYHRPKRESNLNPQLFESIFRVTLGYEIALSLGTACTVSLSILEKAASRYQGATCPE